MAGTEPRLGSGFLGGQLRKGGLHQPPFSLRPVLRGGWPVRDLGFPRVCHRSGSVQRAYPLGPSFFVPARRSCSCPSHGHGTPHPLLRFSQAHLGCPEPNPLRFYRPPYKANFRAQITHRSPPALYPEFSTVHCELVHLKKMSGRWGDRPLGRGGWRVLQPEASSVLPTVPLRSRAAELYAGAIRPKPFYSGSRNQLPITVTILRSTLPRVDSPTGSFFSVLPGVPARLFLVPTYLFRAIPRFSRAYKAAKMSSRRNSSRLIRIRGPLKNRGELPTCLTGLSP